MKLLKKILLAGTACVLVGGLILGLTGCSNTGWIAKNENAMLSTGVYNYCLYGAYVDALQNYVEDYTQPVLDQQIEGKDAETWIKEKAMEQMKSMLLVEDLMKKYNLTLTDKEKNDAKSAATNQYATQQEFLESLKIDPVSFQTAYADYTTKYTKVFQHMYGSNGEKAIPEQELKDYFEKNYTGFRYVLISLYDDQYQSLPDEQLTSLRTLFNGYTDSIKAGKMTVEQAADDFMTSDYVTEYNKGKKKEQQISKDTIFQTRAVNFNNENNAGGYPDDMITALKEMKANEVRTLETEGYLITVVKDDITKRSVEDLSTDEGKLPIQVELKADEYMKYMDEQTASYTNYTVNDAVYAESIRDLLDPKQDTSSTSSADTSSTSASSAAGTSSTSTSSAAGTSSAATSSTTPPASSAAGTASTSTSSTAGTSSAATSSTTPPASSAGEPSSKES